MNFNTLLNTLPPIEDLVGLAIMDGETQIHYIPAIAGKLGSLRVYNALAEAFHGRLDRASAQQGIQVIWLSIAKMPNNIPANTQTLIYSSRLSSRICITN
ncbi:hypothetical protein AAUPMC_16445 [Pasteurella multocida subsp. multocida str. Anand1_cattle]|nr:hypothetical protein AAUPMC_16445 [Pasteurella multocida subsp. multocida str. Anand1_cattle]